MFEFDWFPASFTNLAQSKLCVRNITRFGPLRLDSMDMAKLQRVPQQSVLWHPGFFVFSLLMVSISACALFFLAWASISLSWCYFLSVVSIELPLHLD